MLRADMAGKKGQKKRFWSDVNGGVKTGHVAA
jgi:hypothetical protein